MDKRIILSVLLMMIFACSAIAKESPTIVVVKSLEISPYKLALNGFKEQLTNKGIKANYFEYNLEGDGKNLDKRRLVKEIFSKSPDFILTLGSGATIFAKDNLADFPVVFSMVLNPVASGFV